MNSSGAATARDSAPRASTIALTAGRRSPASVLVHLERLRFEFGSGVIAEKLAVLVALEEASLRTPREVVRLHEALMFMAAYPDHDRVLSSVERMLGSFGERPDVRRLRARLADSGIAGTEIRFRFFHPMARWLAPRWPESLAIDWKELEHADLLEHLLPLMAPFAATPALDEYAFEPREWIEKLKGKTETDAAFLVRTFERMEMSDVAREIVYDELDVPMTLSPGPTTPSRTHARSNRGRVHYQERPLARERPDLALEMERQPVTVRDLGERDAQAMIDLALTSMVTRQRDLDVFAHGDCRDVRVFDYGEGLQFACIGAKPERRLLLESVYGFLTIKNRVPIGYVLVASLFGSAEVAYNVFETYRGGEAAHVYARVLAMTRTLFGADTFMIPSYQLGEGNDEAIASGAWWFYRKLGFAPRDRAVIRVMKDEESRMRRDPSHRSSPATLGKLASAPLFFSAGPPRDDVLGVLPLANLGLHVLKPIRERFHGDPGWAFSNAIGATKKLLRLGHRIRPEPERLTIQRWAPLVACLPGTEHWSPEERRAAGRVVLAKGGRRESDFVRAFDGHAKLRGAVCALAEREPEE